jgi:hypothetical protein
MCQRFRPRPRPTVPGHWCHRPTTAIRRPSGPCQRPSWPCAAATAAAPPQRSRALSPAATSAPPTQPWILVAVERRRPPPRNPVKVRVTAGGGALLPAPTGVVRSTLARPHVCRDCDHAPAIKRCRSRRNPVTPAASVRATGTPPVGGCRAHAAAAGLPSVHMQTTKFGESLAGAAEPRPLLIRWSGAHVRFWSRRRAAVRSRVPLGRSISRGTAIVESLD